MPTLEFKGKQFVYSHHLGVPFRELQVVPDKSLPAKGEKPSLDDNLIIHGDNLEALKALLPTYGGKVDCIFIDPPYNTGNEGWCYNDNVRSPLMKEWLKKSANPVDKEDLERHDKWLCMMWPRVSLLRELLSDQGSIWITLDDNEVHRFKVIMDEIFGEDNFIGSIEWQKMYTVKNSARHFSEMHDHILVYAKKESNWSRNLLDKSNGDSGYSNPDGDKRGPWTTNAIQARNYYSQGQYEIVSPSGRRHKPPKGTYWRISKASFDELNADGRIWWGRKGDSIPRIKKFLSEAKEGIVPATIWLHGDAGSNSSAKEQLRQIFSDSDEELFLTPKPVELLGRVLDIATGPEAVVLDSFAGSATTGDAVLRANIKDNGNRRFILVECEDYADTLTAERMRRIINGYPYSGTQREELHRENITWSTLEKRQARVLEHVASIEDLHGHEYDKIKKQIKGGVLTVIGERKVEKAAPGLGGGFTYCTLGDPIDIESLLTGKALPSFEALARYVFYTATGQSLEKVGKPAPDGFIGETDLFRVHLFYQPKKEWLRSNDAALNAERVAAIEKGNQSGKRAIVFAVAKFMSQKELTARRIEFCQLPYAVHRILGD